MNELLKGNIVGVSSGRKRVWKKSLVIVVLGNPRGNKIKDKVNEIKRRQVSSFLVSVLEKHF